MNVHIVDDMNSLATLNALRDEILARRQEFRDRGIQIVEFGVDLAANRVRVGVKGLTQSSAAYLITEFGADQIYVFEGGQYAPAPRERG